MKDEAGIQIRNLEEYHRQKTLHTQYRQTYEKLGADMLTFPDWLNHQFRAGDRNALFVGITDALMQLDGAEVRQAILNDEIRASQPQADE